MIHLLMDFLKISPINDFIQPLKSLVVVIVVVNVTHQCDQKGSESQNLIDTTVTEILIFIHLLEASNGKGEGG